MKHVHNTHTTHFPHETYPLDANHDAVKHLSVLLMCDAGLHISFVLEVHPVSVAILALYNLSVLLKAVQNHRRFLWWEPKHSHPV